MGNSLLLNRHIDDDAATATNIHALEQREQKDLAIQLSSSNLFSETLKLKKTLETVSSTRSISDEMHLPLSEKYNRHINIAGFWKNIIAGLDEDTNRRRITLKRLTEQLSTSVELKSIFLETLEKRLGYIGCAVERMRNESHNFVLKRPWCYQLPKYQKIVDNGELWYIIPDLGGSPFKESGFDFGEMDKEYIENNLLVVFQFWNDCEPFLPPTSVERWRKTYSRRLDILKYNKLRFDHETNKAESKDSKILQKKIKEYTSVDILHSQDDFKSLVWPELLLSCDVVEKICMEYGKLFNEGLLAGFDNVRIEKSISGLIEFARASGSSKAILTLIASIIKLHHISLNSNVIKINGLVEKVKKQMRDLIARFGRIKQTMNAFPHGIF